MARKVDAFRYRPHADNDGRLGLGRRASSKPVLLLAFRLPHR